jgi:hypothetical protein
MCRRTPEAFFDVVAAYRDDLVVAAECMFTWYWLADVCAAEEITFVLGHALAMKAIHGGKAKKDKLDSFKIASLLRGGATRPSTGIERVQPRDHSAARRTDRCGDVGIHRRGRRR